MLSHEQLADIETSLSLYESAKEQGYYLNSEKRWKVLKEKLTTLLSMQIPLEISWFDGVKLLQEKSSIELQQPSWKWCSFRSGWPIFPKTWGIELVYPLYIKRRKWGPISWRAGFYIKKD